VLLDGGVNQFKVFADHEGQKYQVTTVAIFQSGLKPAWEDPIVKAGSGFRLDLGPHQKDPEVLQNVWETFVFDMMSGNCPHTESICGLRIV